MRTVGVAVAGLGNVGRETARLLWARRAEYARAAGAPVRLVAVCDRQAQREARALGLPASVRRTRDYRSLLLDPSVDIVVELFGGAGDARRLVRAALGAGKHVVTGNKYLLSLHWPEVQAAAARAGRRVAFEAAVAGGIPIISGIHTGLAANRIGSVYGILNGTTNYILSTMARDGCGFADALRQAQRLGMAEKDPTLDLNGSDTTHKVSILASMLTGSWVPPARVPREGIERVGAEDVRFAAEKLGRAVRLLGVIGIRWGTRPLAVEIHVQPSLVPLEHPLAAVHGGYNAVLVSASSAEDLMFYGKGAGPGPAASAAIADVLALTRELSAGRTPAPAGPPAPVPLRYLPECPAAYYLRLKVRDRPGALARITGLLGRHRISIAQIHQEPPAKDRWASVMITTHATERARFDPAVRAISALDAVAPGPTRLRLLPG